MKPILDACCGAKMFHFDKNNPSVEFTDIRETDEWIHGRRVIVSPDTVATFENLPYENESFHLVIFDPPHLKRVGDNSWLKVKYGRLEKGWEEMIAKGFEECWRVLKPNGTLIFKWNEYQIPLKEVLSLMPQKPLIGNKRVGPNSAKTHWIVFFKEEQ